MIVPMIENELVSRMNRPTNESDHFDVRPIFRVTGVCPSNPPMEAPMTDKPVTYTFSLEEARILSALVDGACDPNRFCEGGDYQLNWARDCGVVDLDALLLKLSQLPSYGTAR